MLRVRGESMIDAGILNGDYVVATQIDHPANGDIVVAGIPGGEATVKTYARSGNEVTLTPHNPTMEPMVFTADQVELYGKVVTVMRRYLAALASYSLGISGGAHGDGGVVGVVNGGWPGMTV